MYQNLVDTNGLRYAPCDLRAYIFELPRASCWLQNCYKTGKVLYGAFKFWSFSKVSLPWPGLWLKIEGGDWLASGFFEALWVVWIADREFFVFRTGKYLCGNRFRHSLNHFWCTLTRFMSSTNMGPFLFSKPRALLTGLIIYNSPRQRTGVQLFHAENFWESPNCGASVFWHIKVGRLGAQLKVRRLVKYFRSSTYLL